MILALGGVNMSETSETYKSILKSTADRLDSRDFTTFYDDLIATINTCFGYLHEYGCGPEDGFEITGETETWDDYECKTLYQKQIAKTYVFMKTKIIFDPPQSGPLLSAMQKELAQAEWHITNCR